jgi:glycosyltransferase involved in cell wall biosynthesis
MPGVVWHPAPIDAVAAFPDHAIAVVPLQIGSGIRMRILEAWARGLPVVASPVAAAGLDVQSGRELLLAHSADEFVAAIARLQSDPRLREHLRAGGRDYLGARHAIDVQSERMVELYARAGAGRR